MVMGEAGRKVKWEAHGGAPAGPLRSIVFPREQSYELVIRLPAEVRRCGGFP